MTSLEKSITEIAMALVKEKGLQFTLDDIALHLKISKKTIYKAFKSKEDIIMALIKSVFHEIKVAEHLIFCNTALSHLEKLKAILCVYPEQAPLKFEHVQSLETVYPKAYALVNEHLSSNWEETFKLLSLCISEGSVIPIAEEDFQILFLGLYKQLVTTDHENHKLKMEAFVDFIFHGLETRRPL